MKKSKILLCSLLAGVCFAGGMVCVNANADGDVTPITANQLGDNFYMTEGAWVRMANTYKDLGMRFQLNMNAETYKAFTANTDYTNVSYGVLIAPIDYHKYVPLDDETNLANKYNWKVNGELAFETTGRKEIINLSTPAMLENEHDASLMTFYASVVNMKKENLTREYIGVGYVRYDADENSDGEAETHYEFAKFENSYARSMAYIAQQAIENGKDVNNLLLDSYVNPVKTQDTTLLVEHYFQNEDGTYPTEATQTTTQTAKIDSEATAQLQTAYGYRYMPNPNEVLAGKVYAGGKTVLKAYYAIEGNSQTFAFVKKDEVAVTPISGDEFYGVSLFNETSMRVDLNQGSSTQVSEYEIELPKFNYAACKETTFTLTYATTGTTIAFDGMATTVGLAKNAAMTIIVKEQLDGKIWLFIDGAKTVALNENVANGTTGLSFSLKRGGGANHILIIAPFTATAKDGTVTQVYNASEATSFKGNGTAQPLTITVENGALVFNPSGGGAWNYNTLPAIPYANYDKVEFTCTINQASSTFCYDDIANLSKVFATTSEHQVLSVETKTGADGKVTLTVDEKYTAILSDDVASGKTGWVFAVYQKWGAKATISPMVATEKAETAIDVQTLAILATTVSTQTNDQPQVSYTAALGKFVYLYNTASGTNKGATADVNYDITVVADYSAYTKITFNLVLAYDGSISFDGETFVEYPYEQQLTVTLQKEVNGKYGVYVDGEKKTEISAETLKDGWTFTVNRANNERTYQIVRIVALTVLN